MNPWVPYELERAAIDAPRIGCIEWRCWKCGNSGAGFMPEEHASGACEATKTAIIATHSGFVDGGGI